MTFASEWESQVLGFEGHARAITRYHFATCLKRTELSDFASNIPVVVPAHGLPQSWNYTVGKLCQQRKRYHRLTVGRSAKGVVAFSRRWWRAASRVGSLGRAKAGVVLVLRDVFLVALFGVARMIGMKPIIYILKIPPVSSLVRAIFVSYRVHGVSSCHRVKFPNLAPGTCRRHMFVNTC